MSSTIHYTNCPVCGSVSFKKILSAKDFTVSGETFEIDECETCSLRFTQDVPGPGSIGTYYQSEDYISHTNTSKGFINRLYQSVRNRTVRKKRKLVQQQTGMGTGNLLDVGSGTGAFLHEMSEHGWTVTGMEPDARARAVAQKLYGLNLSEGNEFYQLPAASFDAITLWHVLEHVHELHGYVQQLKKLLKENGRILIAVPNYTSKDAAVYKAYWAAYDVPRHLYHFSPPAMKTLMEKNGLRILKYRPMWYDSFYISLLSSRYKHEHPRLFSAGWNGLRSNLKAMGDVKKCSSVIYVVGK